MIPRSVNGSAFCLLDFHYGRLSPHGPPNNKPASHHCDQNQIRSTLPSCSKVKLQTLECEAGKCSLKCRAPSQEWGDKPQIHFHWLFHSGIFVRGRTKKLGLIIICVSSESWFQEAGGLGWSMARGMDLRISCPGETTWEHILMMSLYAVLSHSVFATLWTVAHQAPLSM